MQRSLKRYRDPQRSQVIVELIRKTTAILLMLLGSTHRLGAQRPLAQLCEPGLTRSGTSQSLRAWNDPRNTSRAFGTIVGEIASIDERPLAGIRVFLQRTLTGGDPIASVQADSAGVFRFKPLAADRHILGVVGIGYLSKWHELRLLPEVADTMCLRLRVLRRHCRRWCPRGRLPTRRLANER